MMARVSAGLEGCQVRAAVRLWDVIRERVDILLKAAGVLERDLDLRTLSRGRRDVESPARATGHERPVQVGDEIPRRLLSW